MTSFCIIALLLASYSVTAWSPFAREYFCRKSIERVWSFEEMLECIPYGEYNRFVADRIKALYPLDEFYMDHTVCPVSQGDDREWICGNLSQNPTGSLAEVWFNKSRDSYTLCERMINYCIAADFYINQFHPLHNTNHAVPRYYEKFDAGIDEHIKALDENWTESQTILFENFEQLTGISKKARYYQEIKINGSAVAKALDGLYMKGALIKAYDFQRTTTLHPKPVITLQELPKPQTTTIPPVVVKAEKRRSSPLLWVFALITFLLVFAISWIYHTYQKKPIKIEETKTNLFHIPGISSQMVERLLGIGIDSIKTLMWAPPRRVAKKSGLLVGDVKALKRAQRSAFQDYFLINCPLSMDDLTPKQRELVIGHKNRIIKMMRVYRNKDRLTPRQLADLNEIMSPLSPEEAEQVQRLIDGKAKLDEDLPYRILVTSAEIDVGKIKIE